VGRPRIGWVDVVQRDALQLLGIRGWRRRAENRDEWRRRMREAKAGKGLQRHIWNVLPSLHHHHHHHSTLGAKMW